jgi:hypothetical protein
MSGFSRKKKGIGLQVVDSQTPKFVSPDPRFFKSNAKKELPGTSAG